VKYNAWRKSAAVAAYQRQGGSFQCARWISSCCGGRSPTKHRIAVKQLFDIEGSAHPGPGLGGMSGYLAAADIG
jgi:phytoene dehydrogenase-like protein